MLECVVVINLTVTGEVRSQYEALSFTTSCSKIQRCPRQSLPFEDVRDRVEWDDVGEGRCKDGPG